MKFDLLLPTRKRVGKLKNLLSSISDTKSGENEVKVSLWVDKDDQETIDFLFDFEKFFDIDISSYIKERVRYPSTMWNYLWERSDGDIFFMANDDMEFVSDDWDIKTEERYSQFSDGIILLAVDDMRDHKRKKRRGWLPYEPNWAFRTGMYFLPKEVCNTLGYFTWPEEVVFFNGSYTFNTFYHLWILSGKKRIEFLEDVKIRHLPGWDQGEEDETYEELTSLSDDQKAIDTFLNTMEERISEAKKLVEVIE